MMAPTNTRWRSITDEELSFLQAAAQVRKAMPTQQARAELGTPEPANNSFAGALYWSITVLVQDRPGFVVLALLAILWQLVDLVIGIFGTSILKLIGIS